jgi:branched-chain amino acid transport system substrate-binding protein
VHNFLRLAAATAIASLAALPAHAADITVGLITSMTGPGASIGIPYSKGLAAGLVYKDEVNGIKIKAVQLDDASDPSTGTRDARKLIEQDKVDVLMGAGATPTTLAIAAVSHELKVPLIALTPTGDIPGDAGSWMISVPQPPTMMVEAVVKRMTASATAAITTRGAIWFTTRSKRPLIRLACRSWPTSAMRAPTPLSPHKPCTSWPRRPK